MGGIISIIRKTLIMRISARFLAVSLALACLISIPFVPDAHAAGAERLSLEVTQVITSSYVSVMLEQTIIYRLTPKTAGAPMPISRRSGLDGYTFAITGTVKAQMEPIIFNTPGTYTYELNCITNEDSGFIYDQRVYTIEAYVASDLTTNYIVYNDGGRKAGSIEYRHRLFMLSSDPNDMLDPPVVKTVSGNPAADSTFTFRLTAGDPSNPMPYGSIGGVKTVQVTGSGSAEFGTWSYSAEGTYYYTVSEVNPGGSSYIYDDAVYTITDTVRAEDNRLVVTRVVTNSSSRQVLSLMFINTYKGGGNNGGETTPTPTPTPSPPPTPLNPTPGPTPGASLEPSPQPTPPPGGSYNPSGPSGSDLPSG